MVFEKTGLESGPEDSLLLVLRRIVWGSLR